MKKIVLTALNAKYFHTNLAVRCLKACAGDRHDVNIIERTINDNIDDVLEDIISSNPDAVGFSCYIWNIEQILQLASNLKKILPECFIFLGGPEVSFEYIELLERNSYIDMIIKGEGELTFASWLNAFEAGNDFSKTKGTVIRVGDAVLDNKYRSDVFDLDSLSFLYDDLSEYENKMIYFETSRGCPMKCAYCMSGLNGDMTYMDVAKVKKAFSYFLENNVRQVKLVDRTFNHPISRAKEIILMLFDQKKLYPNSSTNFHFEITASILDEELLDILSKAPDGLIQFEAGVQSTNRETLKAISRTLDSKKLLANIKKISNLSNITVFADLIAGLPHEGYESFKKSFSDVYELGTSKIHLGFLKVLKGSDIKAKAEQYGIEYSEKAPYKVIKTNDISYAELRKLERIEHLLELYKNSDNFHTSIIYAVSIFDNPFKFFESFADFAHEKYFFGRNQSIIKQYDLLYDFLIENSATDEIVLKDKLRYDWVMMEKPRRYPKSLEPKNIKIEREAARRFYNNTDNIEKYLPEYKKHFPQVISRMCHILFSDDGKKATLYDYKKPKRNRTCKITLKEI